VARQQELFNNEIKNIEEAEKARTKAAEDRVAAEKKQQDDAVKAQQDAYAQQQKAAEGAANEQRRVQEEVYKQQQKLFEEQQKAAAAEATRQEERLRKLNTLGEQSIKATDIRTVEGATLVTDLAASAQDPAMIQQRLQTKLLEKIAVGIGQAASNYFNQPVAIVGAARIGGIN
jgi:flagellar biosynthesis GTPase FlhF